MIDDTWNIDLLILNHFFNVVIFLQYILAWRYQVAYVHAFALYMLYQNTYCKFYVTVNGLCGLDWEESV